MRHTLIMTGVLAGLFVLSPPAEAQSGRAQGKVVDADGLSSAIELAIEYDRRLIIEQGLENVREIECAVLGNDDPAPSVLGEIRTSYAFYDYQAKYLDDDGAELIIPADLPAAVTEHLGIQGFR